MPSRSKRRKQRQQEVTEAGGVAPELEEEADTAADISAPETDDVPAADLIAAIAPLRRTRRHPLVPGIRMFTAMLEEARDGYATERLNQLEEALSIDFNDLERQGIMQIVQVDEYGVPDVEHGVQVALEARASFEEQGETVAEDQAAPQPASGYEPRTEEGRRLAASGANPADVEAMDEQVLEESSETPDDPVVPDEQ